MSLGAAKAAMLGASQPVSAGKGYFGGGYDNTSYYSEIDGIQFSNEAAINPAATLSVARGYVAGVASADKGYFGGGISGSGNSAEIDGIQFSDETAINPSATLSVARYAGAGVQA